MPRIEVNDRRIDYGDAGSGTPLVLLHSLLADRSVYDRVLPAFAARHRVLTPNFPGYGGSTGAVGERMEAYADLIAGFLDAVELERVDLLGNGLGGFVATSLALRHPGRIDRLMLVDTGPGFPEPARQPLRTLRARALEQGMEAVLEAAMARMFPRPFTEAAPEVIAERKASLARTDRQRFADACSALVEVDLRPRLGEIPHETLVMVGLADEATPPALSYELAEGIANARLIELPDIGHCPQIQAPETFASHILAFLAR